MEMECIHLFKDEIDFSVCSNCGLEKENLYTKALDTDSKRISNYSVKTSSDDLNFYLDDVGIDLKKEIIETFDMLLQKTNLRGTGKKALLAACYFYRLSDSSALVCKDVYKKFGIDKKKFSEGKQLFLTHFPKYRTLEKKISEFVELIFERFDFPLQSKGRVLSACYKIDGNVKLSNFNPYAVCACVVYRELDASFCLDIKKNIFIKKIGMSEMTVQKINQCLKELNFV
jgi:hypothetical protein